MAPGARGILLAAVLGVISGCGGGGGGSDNTGTGGGSTLTLTTGQAASLVLGQPDFTTGTAPAAINATSMIPVGRGRVVGSFYYQADNNPASGRILGFPMPLSNGESATIVLGATSLTAPYSGTPSAADFQANSTASDGTDLVTSDPLRNRVLVY